MKKKQLENRLLMVEKRLSYLEERIQPNVVTSGPTITAGPIHPRPRPEEKCEQQFFGDWLCDNGLRVKITGFNVLNGVHSGSYKDDHKITQGIEFNMNGISIQFVPTIKLMRRLDVECEQHDSTNR